MKPAIVAALLNARGSPVCDSCLAAGLRADPRAIRRVALDLGTLGDFLREEFALCSVCRQFTAATRVIVMPRALPSAVSA